MIRIFILFLMLLVVALGVSAESLPELEDLSDSSMDSVYIPREELEAQDPSVNEENDRAGILNQLFGSEPRTETVSLGSGMVVGSSGHAVAPSTSSNDPIQNGDLGATSSESVENEGNLEPADTSSNNGETNEESSQADTQDLSTTESRSSSTISEEEVLELIRDELQALPEDITEEDVRTIIREEIALQEQYAPESNTGKIVTGVLLLLAGGSAVGYYFLKGKGPSLPKIPTVQKAPPQLVNYIHANKHFGKVALRRSLAQSGWNPNHVKAALQEAGF